MSTATNNIIKIGTHDGHFHCDEIFACFLLKQLPYYKDAEIIRTREPAKLAVCDTVVDVGGVFDPEKKRFDHHQKTFTDTFHTLRPEKPWTIKLSSAGLIYVHYGRDIIQKLLLQENITNERLTDILFDKMYDSFVQEIDAIDNGINIGENMKYKINTNLSARVDYFNPKWNDENQDEEGGFRQAMNMVGKEFLDKFNYYVKCWWPARELVENAVANRHTVGESDSIIIFDRSVPWRNHLSDIEYEQNLGTTIKYVLYPDKSKTWRIQAVALNETSFESRLPLPAEWCGLRDEVLSVKCGISDCIFVHANGFIGGNKTYDGALTMARKSLELGDEKKL